MNNDKKLTAADIPQEMFEAMQRQFEAAPQVRQMRTEQQLYAKEGNWHSALQKGKEIQALWTAFVTEYVKQTNDSAEQVDIRSIGLTQDELQSVDTNTLTLFMCCDIIDTCILEINDLIKKHSDDLEFDSFDEVRDLSTMVKGKLSVLNCQTTLMQGSTWGAIVDNMYKMMFNKAKSIINKKGENLVNGKK